MNNMLSTALMIIGIFLLVMGGIAMDSFSSDISRFFTGTPTDKSVWMFIAGILAIAVGGVGSAFRSGSSKKVN